GGGRGADFRPRDADHLTRGPTGRAARRPDRPVARRNAAQPDEAAGGAVPRTGRAGTNGRVAAAEELPRQGARLFHGLRRRQCRTPRLTGRNGFRKTQRIFAMTEPAQTDAPPANGASPENATAVSEELQALREQLRAAEAERDQFRALAQQT